MTTWQDLILGNNQKGGVVKRKIAGKSKRKPLVKETAGKRKVNMKKNKS